MQFVWTIQNPNLERDLIITKFYLGPSEKTESIAESMGTTFSLGLSNDSSNQWKNLKDNVLPLDTSINLLCFFAGSFVLRNSFSLVL